MTSATGRRIAVVTGGSGGVGRATVQAFAEAGVRRRRTRPRSGRPGRRRQGRRGRRRTRPGHHRTDVADPDAVQRAAEQVEAELGEIDVWVNVAFSGSLAYSWDTSERGVPPDDRGHLLRTGVRHPGRAAAHAPARPRRHHQRRVRAGLPLDPAAVGLLRRQARRCRLHPVSGDRARQREEQRQAVYRPAARTEHPAVQLEPQQDGRPPDAGGTDLPAGAAREGDRLSRRAPAPQHVGGHLHRLHHPRRASRAEAARPLPRPHRHQVAAEHQGPAAAGARTCSSPRTPTPTAARTAPSTTQAHARDPWLWATMHRAPLLGGAASRGRARDPLEAGPPPQPYPRPAACRPGAGIVQAYQPIFQASSIALWPAAWPKARIAAAIAAPADRRYLREHRADRRAAVFGQRVDERLAVVGEFEDQVATVDRGVTIWTASRRPPAGRMRGVALDG